jgi:hypothetical protein
MCVHSVIIDSIRLAEQNEANTSLEALEAEDSLCGSSVEDEALTRMQYKSLWDCLSARLHDEKERRVIYGSFVLNLKPQELQTTYRGTFRDVEEIYRVKQNVLERLRRDPDFRQLFG